MHHLSHHQHHRSIFSLKLFYITRNVWNVIIRLIQSFVYLPMKLINEPNFKYSITATHIYLNARIKNYGSMKVFLFFMTFDHVLNRTKERIIYLNALL